MKVSIEPKQTAYNSRYMQGIEVDKLSTSITLPSNSQNKEAAKKYISRFISFNLKALCPGLTDNTILYGFDCYIINIDNGFNESTQTITKNVSVLITPGAVVCDSTLLILSRPQILTIDYTGLTNIRKLACVLEFNYNITAPANRHQVFQRLNNKHSLTDSNLNLIPPFSVNLVFVDTDDHVINSNGVVWNEQSNYLFLAVFDFVRDEDDTVFVISQYASTLNHLRIIDNLLEDFNIDFSYNKPLIKEKVTNQTISDSLLTITIDGTVYDIPRFSFIPDDVKVKMHYIFRLQNAARFAIPDLPFYGKRFERVARVSQTYHEHNN